MLLRCYAGKCRHGDCTHGHEAEAEAETEVEVETEVETKIKKKKKRETESESEAETKIKQKKKRGKKKKRKQLVAQENECKCERCSEFEVAYEVLWYFLLSKPENIRANDIEFYHLLVLARTQNFLVNPEQLFAKSVIRNWTADRKVDTEDDQELAKVTKAETDITSAVLSFNSLAKVQQQPTKLYQEVIKAKVVRSGKSVSRLPPKNMALVPPPIVGKYAATETYFAFATTRMFFGSGLLDLSLDHVSGDIGEQLVVDLTGSGGTESGTGKVRNILNKYMKLGTYYMIAQGAGASAGVLFGGKEGEGEVDGSQSPN